MSDEPCEHGITGPCRICCLVEREVLAAKEDHDTIATLRQRLSEAEAARDEAVRVCRVFNVDWWIGRGPDALSPADQINQLRTALQSPAQSGGEDIRESMLSVVAMKRRLENAEDLLGKWMFWASGVACKSEIGESIEKQTDTYLGAQQTKESAEPGEGFHAARCTKPDCDCKPCPCGDTDRPGHPLNMWCAGGRARYTELNQRTTPQKGETP